MLLVSLLLWCKMVAVCYFIWPPALQLWSGRKAGCLASLANQNFSFGYVFKIIFSRLPISDFLFLMLHLMLDGIL